MNKKYIFRAVAGLLSLALLLCGCVGFEVNPTGTTEGGGNVESSGNSNINTGVILNLGWSKANTGKNEVTVTVSLDAVNDVKAGIFGANVSWRGDGYGQWNSTENCPDETLLEQLKALGNLGVLGGFVGMLTDSRSFLSYPRHEYFRRILCSLIGSWVEEGMYPNDQQTLGKIIRGISYNNAEAYFGF